MTSLAILCARLQRLLAATDEPFVNAQIILRHARGGETFLEDFATTFPAQLRHAPGGFHGVLERFHDETGMPLLHHLGDGAITVRNHRRAAGHGLDHTRPNGSGQSMGKSSAYALPRNSSFSPSPISPTNSMSGWRSNGSTTVSKR